MKIAYVTLLTTEDYFSGVVTMIASLKATQTQVPICCIVTPNISEEMSNSLVETFGVNIIRKNTIECPEQIKSRLNE